MATALFAGGSIGSRLSLSWPRALHLRRLSRATIQFQLISRISHSRIRPDLISSLSVILRFKFDLARSLRCVARQVVAKARFSRASLAFTSRFRALSRSRASTSAHLPLTTIGTASPSSLKMLRCTVAPCVNLVLASNLQLTLWTPDALSLLHFAVRFASISRLACLT